MPTSTFTAVTFTLFSKIKKSIALPTIATQMSSSDKESLKISFVLSDLKNGKEFSLSVQTIAEDKSLGGMDDNLPDDKNMSKAIRTAMKATSRVTWRF